MEVLKETNLPGLKLFKRGKVRDIYEVEGNLLIVSTDRISAFDWVLPDAIPYKGKVLNGLSRFWFELTREIIPNHLITTQLSEYPSSCHPFRKLLERRSMLVRKTEPIKVECVVRGWLAGSAWREYQEKGEISGIKLPPGLKETSPFPSPLFTPATKSEEGHDENITHLEVERRLGKERASYLKKVSIKIYEFARRWLEKRGFILLDTKLEFGLTSQGEILLIDELLTPDSSRFCLKEALTPGKHPESFDKQYLRDWLESTGWDKMSPPPSLPPEVIEKTSKLYLEVYQKITGETLKE